MLWLLDFQLPFKVYTNKIGKALGGVLVQKKHLVAYETQGCRATVQRLQEGYGC